MPYENKKGADQPVVGCLDSITPILAISKISSLQLVSGAEQAGLSHTWSKTLKTGFRMMWLIFEYTV